MKMQVYVKFDGRINGAIGITYPIEDVVEIEVNESDDFEDVLRLKLSEKYEHIVHLIYEVKK